MCQAGLSEVASRSEACELEVPVWLEQKAGGDLLFLANGGPEGETLSEVGCGF